MSGQPMQNLPLYHELREYLDKGRADSLARESSANAAFYNAQTNDDGNRNFIENVLLGQGLENATLDTHQASIYKNLTENYNQHKSATQSKANNGSARLPENPADKAKTDKLLADAQKANTSASWGPPLRKNEPGEKLVREHRGLPIPGLLKYQTLHYQNEALKQRYAAMLAQIESLRALEGTDAYADEYKKVSQEANAVNTEMKEAGKLAADCENFTNNQRDHKSGRAVNTRGSIALIGDQIHIIRGSDIVFTSRMPTNSDYSAVLHDMNTNQEVRDKYGLQDGEHAIMIKISSSDKVIRKVSKEIFDAISKGNPGKTIFSKSDIKAAEKAGLINKEDYQELTKEASAKNKFSLFGSPEAKRQGMREINATAIARRAKISGVENLSKGESTIYSNTSAKPSDQFSVEQDKKELITPKRLAEQPKPAKPTTPAAASDTATKAEGKAEPKATPAGVETKDPNAPNRSQPAQDAPPQAGAGSGGLGDGVQGDPSQKTVAAPPGSPRTPVTAGPPEPVNPEAHQEAAVGGSPQP